MVASRAKIRIFVLMLWNFETVRNSVIDSSCGCNGNPYSFSGYLISILPLYLSNYRTVFTDDKIRQNYRWLYSSERMTGKTNGEFNTVIIPGSGELPQTFAGSRKRSRKDAPTAHFRRYRFERGRGSRFADQKGQALRIFPDRYEEQLNIDRLGWYLPLSWIISAG